MSFLGDLVNQFTHQGQGGGQQGSGGYGQQQQNPIYGGYPPQQPSYGQSYGGGGPQGPAPQVYPPWRVTWDDRDHRWLFINEQTGQRTFDYPHPNTGYNGPQGYAPPPQQAYQSAPHQQAAAPKNHNLAYGALGAAGGLAAGALLMHEGEEVKEHWKRDEYRAEEGFDRREDDLRRDEYRADDNFRRDEYRTEDDIRRDEYRADDDIRRDEYRAEDDIRRDEYRAEDRVDRWGDDVRYAPEEAAGWAGRKVQAVEDIPEDVEGGFEREKYRVEDGFDNVVDDVEDFPERVAGRIGDGVGDVERFDDRVEDSYDAGRDDQRYDDDQRDDRW